MKHATGVSTTAITIYLPAVTAYLMKDVQNGSPALSDTRHNFPVCVESGGHFFPETYGFIACTGPQNPSGWTAAGSPAGRRSALCRLTFG